MVFGRLRGELVDIVEWLDDSRDTIVWRFPRYENEIKMGARLVVRESQVAVFVNEGRVADVFAPGTYTLETQNLPILSTLRGWAHGFHSPFKAEVYFVNTRQFDMKWGTQHPAMMRDSEFGMVRVRAFGMFTVRVADPEHFLKELVGTDQHFRTDEVSEFLRQTVASKAVNALASSGIPVLDLAAHQLEIGQKLASVLTVDLHQLGLEVPRFVIENVSLPPEVERAFDERSRRGVLGNLDEHMKLKAADALGTAAANEGLAGTGVGMGVGAGLGAQLAAAFVPSPSAPAAPAAPAAPPPLPSAGPWFLGVDGQSVGPLTAAEVRSRVASGAVSGSTLAWRAGMDAWTPLAEVPELAAGATPPPLPPA